MRGLFALAWGALFGAGLTLSGMTQPAKVLGFLDVAGAWDASLLFVMAGALAVFAALRPWVLRHRPAAERPPGRQGIDGRLLVGAAVFGAGWGVAGYCPGPAIVAAGSGSEAAIVVVVAMLVGTKLADVLTRSAASSSREPAHAADPCG